MDSSMGFSGPVLLGPESTEIKCPFCKGCVKTTVSFTANADTYIAAGIWGRICRCCCIPFCYDSAKNSDHYCPMCSKYVGTYRK